MNIKVMLYVSKLSSQQRSFESVKASSGLNSINGFLKFKMLFSHIYIQTSGKKIGELYCI